MKPRVQVTFKDISKDEVYIINKAENKVVNIISQKHSLPDIGLTLEPTGKGNYADLEKKVIHIDTSAESVRKAIRDNTLDGLLAHETMHLALQEEGEDQKVTATISKAVGKREEKILNICQKYEDGKYCKDALQVMVTLGMVLRDILNDGAVIDVGLGEELYEYYLSTITTKIEAEKRVLGDLGPEEVENLFIAMVGTMATWVSFYRNGMEQQGAKIRNELFNRLSDIPISLRLSVNKLSELMMKMNPTNEEDVDALVEEVLKAFEDVLKKKSAKDREGAKSPAEP